MKYWCIGIITLWLLMSCIGRSEQLEVALQLAGDNRAQLEKVLDRYKNDSLKYKAAVFLIENLPYHNGYAGEWLENYIAQYDKLLEEQKYSHRQIQDSLEKTCGNFNVSRLERKNDVFIDAELLIENIEWAFKVRNEQPWGKNIPFEDFCEFVLPYRVADEKLSSWRAEVYNRYNPILDSIRGLPEAEDPLIVAGVLLDSIWKQGFTYKDGFPIGLYVGTKVLDWRVGTCLETSILVQYVFRSVGLPCIMDKMLMKGDNNAAHFWNSIEDRDGKTYYNCLLDFGTLDSISTYQDPKGKVYRTTFSINREMMAAMGKTSKEVHPAFRYPLLRDVTADYTNKKALTVKILPADIYGDIEEDDLVYLCVSSRMEWVPVAWSKYAKEGTCFENVGDGVVFRLATYKEGGLQFCSTPFLPDKNTGSPCFYPSDGKRMEVCLFSKFNPRLEMVIRQILGGVFEGSDDPDFEKRDTLNIIMEYPRKLYNTIQINSDKAYRYVRYQGGKGSNCRISEMAFYTHPNDTLPLKGKIIGETKDAANDIARAFDGNPYTSFDYKKREGGWVGLDLGKPQSIGKIVFTPRNNDNYIRKGDMYELFYCKAGHWESIDKLLAKSDSLLWTVPEGALLYLKNHTRGNMERIFEYKDGKQIFW